MKEFIKIFTHRSFIITIILTLTYFGIGFTFLHYGLADYGWIIFILLPYSLGLAIGKMESNRWYLLSLSIGVLIFIVFLLTNALEGLLCVVMAIPIIIPLVLLGIFTNKYLTKKGIIKSSDNFNGLIFPLVLILFGAPIEKYFFSGHAEMVEVRTERVYAFTTEQVYDAIKSVDTLDAVKPFLMKLDLPIPHKCILEKEEVGGLRTCYFSGGTITERITELKRGTVLKMDVIDYQLTGRNWLGFDEAIYHFKSVGADSCLMTRITTYSSVLKPRWYWEPLERLGIRQEHEYVFDNLNNDLIKLNR